MWHPLSRNREALSRQAPAILFSWVDIDPLYDPNLVFLAQGAHHAVGASLLYGSGCLAGIAST